MSLVIATISKRSPHALAEMIHQRGLAGADRPADADPERSAIVNFMSGRASYSGFRAPSKPGRARRSPNRNLAGRARSTRRPPSRPPAQPGEDALPVTLSDNPQPQSRRHQVRRKGLEIRGQRSFDARAGTRRRRAENGGMADVRVVKTPIPTFPRLRGKERTGAVTPPPLAGRVRVGAAPGRLIRGGESGALLARSQRQFRR